MFLVRPLMAERQKSGIGIGGGCETTFSYQPKKASSFGYLRPPVKAVSTASLPPSPKNQPLSIHIPTTGSKSSQQKIGKQLLEPLHRTSSTSTRPSPSIAIPASSSRNLSVSSKSSSSNAGAVAPPSSLVEDGRCCSAPKRDSLSLVLDPDFKNLSTEFHITIQWDDIDDSKLKNGYLSPLNSSGTPVSTTSTNSGQSGRQTASVFSFSPTQKVTIHDILHRTSIIVGNTYLQHCKIQDYTEYALVSDDLHNRLHNRLLQVSIETVCEWYKEFRHGLDPSQYISVANTPLSTKLLFPL